MLWILKWDSGIVPFAFSDRLGADDLGAVFFHPAEKYWRELKAPKPWALDYVYNPYRP